MAARHARDGATLWRHLWLDEHDARRWVGRDGLVRLAQQVRESEAHHLGEIRVCIEAALPLPRLLQGQSPRARALALFERLGIGRTRGRNGVLVYLLLADHAIEVVVDPALHTLAPPAHWQPVVDAVRAHAAPGHPLQGLQRALETIDRLLREHVPVGPGGANPNELPDEPLVI